MANSDIDFNNTTDFGTVKILMLKGEKGDAGNDGISGDYAGLINKPRINGVELDGNKSATDLDLVSEATLETDLDNLESGLQGQMDEITGDLSTLESNVYTKSDVYTKTETNSLLNNKANSADVYTKANVNTLINNALVVEHKTASDAPTVAAGATTTGTIDVSKSGYTPLGVVGFAVNNKISLPHIHLSGTTVSYTITNLTSSSISLVIVSVYVLYLKNN